MATIAIRLASAADAERICAIYNPCIENTTISFEESPVAPAEMAQRIAKATQAGLPWLAEISSGPRRPAQDQRGQHGRDQ